MKNKKLFAILTLLCFMFTLMPVAAFAADPYIWVEDGEEVVKMPNAKVTLNVSNVADNTKFIVFAMKDGKLTDKMSFTGKTGFIDVTKGPNNYMEVTFTEEGEYTVYAVEAGTDSYEEKTVAKATSGELSETAAANELIAKSDNMFILENNVITVNPVATNYSIEASLDGNTWYTQADLDADNNVLEATLATISNGYDNEELWIKLLNNNVPVAGKALNITTNSYAIESSKETVTTNPNGIAKIKLSSVLAGDFKVYVEFGSKADLTIDVTADSTKPATITTQYAPTSPVALDTALVNSDITFAIADINGNNVDNTPALVKYDGTNVNTSDYTIKVVEAPKGSSVKAANISLMYNAANAVWLLNGADLDVEGTYTFKVMLANGASTTATITVKEFQTPVALKMIYKQNTVELDGEAILDKLFYVDANGVTKSLLIKNQTGVITGIKDAKVAATGYAVDTFDATNGTLVVEENEKYVGSKVTVIAVAEKYNLTTSVDLMVANEAASVKYASTDAEVAVNNTLVANIVDEDGNKVGLANGIAKANVSYVVLEKPEGAKVAISTKADNNLATKGEFKVSFTANKAGNYKLQTVVSYKQANADENIKYYVGVEDITVGNAGFEDIVVMSIGSNEIVINDTTAVIDAAPIVENNRTFVPFRALAQAFGAEVAYDEATQAVTAELNDVTVVLTIGSATYTVNGVEKTADVAPFINGSRTMVPVRFVAEAFNISVTPTYDDNGATADILFAK